MPDPITKADKAWKAYQKKMQAWKKKNPGEDVNDAFDFPTKAAFMKDYNSKGKKPVKRLQDSRNYGANGWNKQQAAQFVEKYKGKNIGFVPKDDEQPMFEGKFVGVKPSMDKNSGYEVVIQNRDGKKMSLTKKGLSDLYRYKEYNRK